ncbi:7TM diverse intracellular signaling domain-containing protein [Anditalea andensis]|nr:7TM diverse intracellular signaling domain-containing protein [Anditalea andensis]
MTPTVVNLDEDVSSISVIQMMDFYLDTTSVYDIDDVAAPSFQDRFQKISDPHVIYDYLDAALWMRLTVNNLQDSHTKSWYFESWGFDIKNISFYFPNPDGSFAESTAGFDLPFGKRDIHHKNFNYLLNLLPSEKKTYYIKVNRNYNQEFVFHLRTNEKFISHSLNEYLLLGIYYGVLILILIFNLYLFFSLKDRLYLYFVCLILACIWFSLGRDGFGFQYIWPNTPWINRLTNENFIEFFIILATLLFSNRFVQKYTKSDKVIKFTYWAILVKMAFFINQLYFFELYYITYISITILILLVPFSLGLRSLAKVNIYSWSYIMAYGCLFLVIMYSYSKTIDIFDNPVLNWYFVYPVIFLEMVLFSFSIFRQIKFLQNEYIVANRERALALEKNNQLTLEMNTKLKEKVKARTEEIEAMAADLARKNVELQTTNLKLQELNSQVSQMNKYLEENNHKLQVNMKQVNQDMALMKGLDFEDFKNVFPDKDSCLKFLSELKWKERYICKKCGFNKFTNGPNHSKRCKSCNYLESPTVDTLFHKVKFPIEKAFYMLYLSNRKDIELTATELSEILELRRETCWTFKNKIALAMEKVDHNIELNGWESLALVHLE